MGHVPSSEICNKFPFIVDLESVKGAERLAAIALTVENVGPIDSPLFAKFYAARCEESVRHWYKACPDRTAIPTPPTPEEVYSQFIAEPSAYVAKNVDRRSEKFTPVPIVLLRLRGPLVQKWSPTLDEICAADNCDVVGYFGCRHFDTKGNVKTMGTVAMFLTKAFHNEAKSVSIIEVACKCYAHFCASLGATKTAWPQEMTVATLDTNLPCLRLMQKLLSSMPAELRKSAINDTVVHHDVSDCRFHSTVRNAAIIAAFGNMMAERVTQVGTHHVLRTKAVEPAPAGSVHPTLDGIVSHAKTHWKESNRPVAESTQPQVLLPSKKEIRRHDATPSNASTGKATPPPSDRSSSSTDGIAPSPSTISSRSAKTATPAPASIAKALEYATPVNAIEALDVEVPVAAPAEPQTPPAHVPLLLSKGTFFHYYRRGMWMTSQWRDEDRYVTLAPEQEPATGLLCVQAMEGNEFDVAIFDEYGRPAKLRLEHAIFYIEPTAAYFYDEGACCYISFPQLCELQGWEMVQEPAYYDFSRGIAAAC